MGTESATRRSTLLGGFMTQRDHRLASPREPSLPGALPAHNLRPVLMGLALIGVLALFVGGLRSAGGVGPAGDGTSSSPLAVRAKPTKKIVLASGRANGVAWTFVAQSNQTHLPGGIPTGPCLGIDTQHADGRLERLSCQGPTTKPTLVVNVGYLDGDPNTMLVYGVTSAEAATVEIDVGGGAPVSVAALSTPMMPGLRFYVALLPAQSVSQSVPADLSVTAVGGDGTALLHNDPDQTAPPPPPPHPLPVAPPGTHPVWPIDGPARYPTYRTVEDVVTDFAIRALGIPSPMVTDPGSASDVGIGIVTVFLPAADRALAVQVQRQADGNWVITQVGNQRNLEGITLLPAGEPEPIMRIHPPAAATSADLTQVGAEGTHHLRLTAEELRTGIAHLAPSGNLTALQGPSIHSILIVYRDHANRVVDASGGEYG